MDRGEHLEFIYTHQPLYDTSKMLYYNQKYFSILNVKPVSNIKCNGYVFQYFRHSGVLYMCIVKL